MIFPVFILLTPLAFGLCMIFDAKNFGKDMKKVPAKCRAIRDKIKTWKVKAPNDEQTPETVETAETVETNESAEENDTQDETK